MLFERTLQRTAGVGEMLRRRVVGGREPAVSQPCDASEACARAPASDPKGDAIPLAWTGRQLDVGRSGVVARLLGHRLPSEQRSQHGDRLIESFPALLERDAENSVVTFGGSRAQGGDESPVGEDVDRGQRLGQRNRAP